ncbi:hypothetical protein EVAR_62626_1 [Eumeta japonica]|uniref:RNase H type-1 domain-containing protein n=1 Tax=Eumeta variegata TaxID=151549 RepID=A0A4C1ZKL1_EUMVA|nr:hypothetical protein EVAR_62626_1 [Eumeta japonica]
MRWGDRNKRKFVPQKTKIILFTRKQKYDIPIIRMAGKPIELVNELKNDYLLPGREFGRRVSYLEQPHPSTLQRVTYEPLENVDPEIVQKIAGQHVYTDGSKIEGKVDATLTWWKEVTNLTISLDPFCTVFQSELYALYRAILLVKSRTEPKASVLSDSKSSLELPETRPLTHINPKSNTKNVNQPRVQALLEGRTELIQAIPTTIRIREEIPKCGVEGRPGVRLRPVALFMDCNSERLGINSCCLTGPRSMSISPRSAVFLNGSTFKTSKKRKVFDALSLVKVGAKKCRIARTKNKTLMLFSWEEKTLFFQACTLLSSLGDLGSEGAITPHTISVDEMSVSFETGEVVDRLGCIKAFEVHEVVVYEDRGKNLNYFLQCDLTNTVNVVDTWEHLITSEGLSASERLQQRITEDKKAESQERLQAESSQTKLRV